MDKKIIRLSKRIEKIDELSRYETIVNFPKYASRSVSIGLEYFDENGTNKKSICNYYSISHLFGYGLKKCTKLKQKRYRPIKNRSHNKRRLKRNFLHFNFI